MAIRKEILVSETTIETLARRLDRVERENRRLRQAGVVALAVVAAVVLMGQAKGVSPREATHIKAGFIQADLIEATQIHGQRFVLQDPKRGTLGGLSITDDGTPMFFLDSKPGKGGSSIMVAVKNDVMSINLFAGQKQAAIAPGILILRGTEGKIQGSLAPVNGFSGLTLNDKDGKIRARLLVTPNGKGFLSFQDKAGKNIWSAP